ncbi:hypothetical protein ACFV0T_37985 [Streptomyces sp. NPDC059582]|uniref:hypothetical protein n=1 Tax=Streptomyces sp. NPDC059582 TaxID=3346875 RepID=UPI0036BEF34B
MSEQPKPGLLGTEARQVEFPDGSRGIILVKAGLPQVEADLLAAKVWAERPEAVACVDASAAGREPESGAV